MKKLITLDVECYINYFLILIKRLHDGKVIYFEKTPQSPDINIPKLLSVLNEYTIVTFNGNKYDILLVEATIAGCTMRGAFNISKAIIEERKMPWEVRREYNFAALNFDHIDLIEVSPLRASLKMYAGRLHAPKMQDLPIDPYSYIKEEQTPVMRKYCKNDNDNTELLLNELEKEIDLRVKMSAQYKVDLRSKSDAQVAEAVIKHELRQNHGIDATRPVVRPGRTYRYEPPAYLQFETDQLKELFHDFTHGKFIVGKNGHVELPEALQKRKFTYNMTTYKIGIGGLHSAEKSVSHVADEYMVIKDFDVTSYYPMIMINNGYAPHHLGRAFLKVYKSLVDRRVAAKRRAQQDGDWSDADSLRIAINGTFGKLANKWSILYAPKQMMQVTVTGQLCLLMLIEMLETKGIRVISANTDGIILMYPRDDMVEKLVQDIVLDWELRTDFNMEDTEYSGVYSRDVNNYIAIKADGEIKSKGAYAETSLRINPANEICIEAVKKYLRYGTPIENTIKLCRDITKFVTVRQVKGGATWQGKPLGKAIRWYYGAFELDSIHYVTTGYKVPRTEGAVPLMDLPAKLPSDIDYPWYITEANNILKAIGFTK